MDGKRLTDRLIDYWNGLREDMPLPAWNRRNVETIEDISDYCCVWRVDAGRENADIYTYEYTGAALKEMLATDPTGLIFASHLQRFPNMRIVQKSPEVVKSLTPIADDGVLTNEKGQVVKFRSCLLPFGTKEGKVTHVLLGMSWKMF